MKDEKTNAFLSIKHCENHHTIKNSDKKNFGNKPHFC